VRAAASAEHRPARSAQEQRAVRLARTSDAAGIQGDGDRHLAGRDPGQAGAGDRGVGGGREREPGQQGRQHRTGHE
jgi:hypothetical protein